MSDLADRLARLRVPLGFVFGPVVWWLAEPTPHSLALGATIAAIGEMIRFWAAGHLRKGVEVTTSGPYRWTAHPLYVGSSVIGAGLAIASARWIVAGLVGGYLAVTVSAAIRAEEARLRERFDVEYTQYRTGAVDGSARRFSLQRALANREPRAVAGSLAALGLLALKMVWGA